ncbi:MAG: MFS transporter [Oscillospiraceae bacterium]|nr:MFS transporter [Oscillospiraceae bacterium]
MSILRPSAAAFLLMMAMAVTTTALSFFVSPVCDELGVGRGTFTLYYSLMTAAGAVSTSFLGQYINKNGVRKVMLLSGFWCSAGLLLFSLSNSVWIFYLVGAAIGLFGTSCISLCANVIVQTSYSSEQASSLLGFVMAGSGVGGMLFSLILPGLLSSYGWRIGYRFLALCWLALVLGAFLLNGRQETHGAVGNRKVLSHGMTRKEALKSIKFYYMAVAVVIYTVGCSIQQQLPSLLAGHNFSSAQVGIMMSIMTASLAVGKIIQGMLYSKMGVARGGTVITVMFIAGFLLLMKPQTAYSGLISLAFGMGIVTTLMPTVVRFVFGSREFASIWGILATASSVGSFVSTPVWGIIYDACGNYTPAMIVTPILLAVALAAMLLALKDTGNRREAFT